MNIFVLDKDPVLAAQYQCDKHVVKMILESAQLLCTSHHVLPNKYNNPLPDFLYRKTHQNHPCALAVQNSIASYAWLAFHALALCDEYTHRYDKNHKSRPIIQWCFDNCPQLPVGIAKNAIKGFYLSMPHLPQCMPDEYKIQGDVVQAYRNYYKFDKMKNIKCVWTNREQPEWIK